MSVFIELSGIDRPIMFLCFLRYIFKHFEPPETFQEIEGFKANVFPVSWKQESIKVVFEEALVIFA